MASIGADRAVPEVALRSSGARPMPMVGMGTAQFPVVHETTKNAVLAAIEVGFRHFDTAFIYGTEKPVGEAVAEAIRRGLVRSREELFVTSKLWCTQNHPDLVLPSLQETLKNLQMEYVDLYLIHLPVYINGPARFPNKKEDARPLDIEGVWRAMEECQRLGLAKAIGVSNFTTKHLERVLAVATIQPAVNQVELNPVWQQRTMRAYCADKGIHVAAYSSLGGQNMDGQGNAVLDSKVLAEIAKTRGKTVAQVALRWIHEQGVTCIVKGYNKERLKQNLEIFDWELTENDRLMISQIPQRKVAQTSRLFSQEETCRRISMASTGTAAAVPEVVLRSGNARPIPMVGMGTAQFPPVHEATKNAVLAAIEVGFRHFDTAFIYGTEKPLGEAVAEALRRGLLQSREELFVTSKLWCSQNHPDLVLPSLRESLKNLQMEYLDLYLIHWPVCVNGPPKFPNKKEDAVPFDFQGVWRAAEECQRLGLAKAIGVSNFTTKHLERVLAVATIPPAVNQVELNPVWQQRTLRAYCADKGIHVAAYSSLGGQNWDGQGNAVLDSDVLAEIAKARGKTVAQVALRWIHEQGVTCIVKSYNKERLKQNLEIFDWELTEEDRFKISQIPQRKVVQATSVLFSQEGEFMYVDPVELNNVEE